MKKHRSSESLWVRLVAVSSLALLCLTLALADTIDAHQAVYARQADIAATATALAQLQQAIFATQTAIAAPASPANPTATRTPRSTVTPQPPINSAPTAIVLVDGLNVRNGPGTGYAVIGSAGAGQQLSVTGQSAGCGWLRVLLPDGRQAWISGATVYTQLSVPCGLLLAVTVPTPVAVATSTRLPSPAQTAAPGQGGNTSGQAIPAPILVRPEDKAEHAFSRLRFYWQWPGQLRENWGFEVRGWTEGGSHNGLHDARATAGIKPDGNGLYSFELTVPSNLTYANWYWTVAVVQLDPYARIGPEAAPRRIFVDTRTPTPVLVPSTTPQHESSNDF